MPHKITQCYLQPDRAAEVRFQSKQVLEECNAVDLCHVKTDRLGVDIPVPSVDRNLQISAHRGPASL